MDLNPAESTRAQLKELIRNVKDYPKPGIVFRDITPLLADPIGLMFALRAMTDPFRDRRVDLVVGAESRGFIFGSAIARHLNCGFVPIRKPGKLPARVISRTYDLEYGSDTLEIHADAIPVGSHILMCDDLLATGGTMKACCQLVEELQGEIVGLTFLIELSFLGARRLLDKYDVRSVIAYDAE